MSIRRCLLSHWVMVWYWIGDKPFTWTNDDPQWHHMASLGHITRPKRVNTDQTGKSHQNTQVASFCWRNLDESYSSMYRYERPPHTYNHSEMVFLERFHCIYSIVNFHNLSLPSRQHLQKRKVTRVNYYAVITNINQLPAPLPDITIDRLCKSFSHDVDDIDHDAVHGSWIPIEVPAYPGGIVPSTLYRYDGRWKQLILAVLCPEYRNCGHDTGHLLFDRDDLLGTLVHMQMSLFLNLDHCWLLLPLGFTTSYKDEHSSVSAEIMTMKWGA